MDEIFVQIMERIAAQMPELSLIDEDYGQLDTDEDTYPVTFPCVLIGNINTDWTSLDTRGVQRGQCSFTVKLAIDCYDDTHAGSGTEGKIAERLRQNNRLYRALQGFTARPEMSRLVRSKSVDYSLPHAVKVYETAFGFVYHDNALPE
jgi:hypothetical protein